MEKPFTDDEDDARSLKEIQQDSFKDYEMPMHEKQVVAEVQRMLDNNEYRSTDQMQEHLELLEDIYNKSMEIRKQEMALEKANWSLEKDIKRIKSVAERLTEHMEKF
ncbi:hypothetical protein JW968_01380 [Candidatus Woesearchaeota archaeon]|nr:hypothetical protein [Candidatus Woesearchaeota archaeon]